MGSFIRNFNFWWNYAGGDVAVYTAKPALADVNSISLRYFHRDGGEKLYFSGPSIPLNVVRWKIMISAEIFLLLPTPLF